MIRSLPRRYRHIVVCVVVSIIYILTISITRFDDIKKISNSVNYQAIKETTSLIFENWKTLIGFTNIDLDQLDAQLPSIHDNAVRNKFDSKFWMMNTNLQHTEIHIPKYFIEGNKNIKVQPYDPRLTLGVYINHLNNEMTRNKEQEYEVPFHWGDWLDLSALNQYLFASDSEKPNCEMLQAQEKQSKREDEIDIRPVSDYCINDTDLPGDKQEQVSPGFHVFDTPGRSSIANVKLSGKSYLYSFAPLPESLIFLSKKGSYSMKPTTKKMLLDSTLVPNYINRTKNHTVDSLSEFKALLNNHKGNTKHQLDSDEVELSHSEFTLDFPAMIKKYEKKSGSLESYKQNYYNSLQYSDYSVKNGGPPKYFSEARLLYSEPNSIFGDHYDWRFFNGISVGKDEQSLVLHRMIRTWLLFSRQHGIKTWIAHGSLLSWYWNGLAFPWDNDIDVQVPLRDLHKLSKYYNQTLIIEDMEEGYGRYFLDCGTFITQRTKANGNNNIDARFIDIDTGLYIDITGLSVTDSETPDRYYDKKNDNSNHYDRNNKLEAYNCRNNHFSLREELSPLVMSSVEGQLAYIPKAFDKILSYEYKDAGLKATNFNHFVFLPALRLWLRDGIIRDYMNDKKSWTAKHNPPIVEEDPAIESPASTLKKRTLTDLQYASANNFELQDIVNLLYVPEVFMEFSNSNEFTRLHKDDMSRLYGNGDTEKGYKRRSVGPLKMDLFEHNLIKHNYKYEEQVEKCIALNKVFD